MQSLVFGMPLELVYKGRGKFVLQHDTAHSHLLPAACHNHSSLCYSSLSATAGTPQGNCQNHPPCLLIWLCHRPARGALFFLDIQWPALFSSWLRFRCICPYFLYDFLFLSHFLSHFSSAHPAGALSNRLSSLPPSTYLSFPQMPLLFVRLSYANLLKKTFPYLPTCCYFIDQVGLSHREAC